MKKALFTSIFLVLTLSQASDRADYLNTNNNTCVYNLEPRPSRGWCYINRSDEQAECDWSAKYSDFIDGFYLNDQGSCVMFEDLQRTGMTYNQFQFQQALLANMLGFFLVFLVGFLFVLQGRR